MNAERTDDDIAGDSSSGRVTPGQRASRRGTGPRRTAEAASPDLPNTPTELPAVPTLAPPTTVLPTTAPLGSAPTTEAPVIDTPTTQIPGGEARAASPADARVVPAPVPTNVYRARRPGVAILLVLPAVGVGVLLVRALAIAAFGDTFDISGILASVCALASLPFLVAGVYGLVTGAAYGAEHYGFKVWARPPLAYLIVGLAFVVAAGFAIG